MMPSSPPKTRLLTYFPDSLFVEVAGKGTGRPVSASRRGGGGRDGARGRRRRVGETTHPACCSAAVNLRLVHWREASTSPTSNAARAASVTAGAAGGWRISLSTMAGLLRGCAPACGPCEILPQPAHFHPGCRVPRPRHRTTMRALRHVETALLAKNITFFVLLPNALSLFPRARRRREPGLNLPSPVPVQGRSPFGPTGPMDAPMGPPPPPPPLHRRGLLDDAHEALAVEGCPASGSVDFFPPSSSSSSSSSSSFTTSSARTRGVFLSFVSVSVSVAVSASLHCPRGKRPPLWASASACLSAASPRRGV